MRIVTVSAGQLPFSQRHMRRAHELRFPLQVTLPANFRLGSFVKERRLVSDLGQLIAVGGFLHQCVAIDAGDAPACVRARFPVGLKSPLMTTQAGFVLGFRGLPGVFPESDHPANALASSFRHMIASRPVTTFTSLFFRFVARIVQKNFPHHGLGKFFYGGGVASFADLGADISRRSLFGRRFGLGGPDRMQGAEEKYKEYTRNRKLLHGGSLVNAMYVVEVRARLASFWLCSIFCGELSTYIWPKASQCAVRPQHESHAQAGDGFYVWAEWPIRDQPTRVLSFIHDISAQSGPDCRGHPVIVNP